MAAPKKISNHTKRKLPADYMAVIKSHTDKVGEIVYAWNSLHAKFLTLFHLMVDKNWRDAGVNIWHAVKSDSVQREMLIGLAKARLEEKNPNLLSNIIWAINSAGELSGFRNAFIHAPINTRGPEIILDHVAATPKHKKKLDSVDRRKLFTALLGDLAQLDQYMFPICWNITDPKGPHRMPWKRRPVLRSLQLFRQSNSQKPNRQLKKARSRQP